MLEPRTTWDVPYSLALIPGMPNPRNNVVQPAESGLGRVRYWDCLEPVDACSRVVYSVSSLIFGISWAKAVGWARLLGSGFRLRIEMVWTMLVHSASSPGFLVIIAWDNIKHLSVFERKSCLRKCISVYHSKLGIEIQWNAVWRNFLSSLGILSKEPSTLTLKKYKSAWQEVCNLLTIQALVVANYIPS